MDKGMLELYGAIFTLLCIGALALFSVVGVLASARLNGRRATQERQLYGVDFWSVEEKKNKPVLSGYTDEQYHAMADKIKKLIEENARK